ncbi:hypothetical protein EYS24_10900 [Salmonella enterica subsp. enterica serovar Hadar]|nr:hypothetical protein EYS24_10900 [Salmonella enterica subsp. enterica serovar Hadar]
MCIIFTLLLFNQNNTVYLHVVTNSFSPESLFTSQYSYCLLSSSDAADDPLCVDLGCPRMTNKKKYSALL